MKLPILLTAGVLVASPFLAACTSQTQVSSSASAPITAASEPAQTSDVVPALDVAASTLDCSTYIADAITVIRQEADVMAADTQYRVAMVACGAVAGEVSAEVVEAFVLENGAWASVGLVSGSDVPFNTTGACESDNTIISCPAFTFSEEGEASGSVEVTQQDSGLVWTFVAQ
jgi:hypothetical protein